MTNLDRRAPWSPLVVVVAPKDSLENEGRCRWIVPRRPPFSVAPPLFREDVGCGGSSGSSSLMAILTATAAAGDMVLLSRCSQGADKALLASPGITGWVSSSTTLGCEGRLLGDDGTLVPSPRRMVVKPHCVMVPSCSLWYTLLAANGLCWSKCDGGSDRFVAPVVMLVTTPCYTIHTIFFFIH